MKLDHRENFASIPATFSVATRITCVLRAAEHYVFEPRWRPTPDGSFERSLIIYGRRANSAHQVSGAPFECDATPRRDLQQYSIRAAALII